MHKSRFPNTSSGQKTCSKCRKSYNNRAIPAYCNKCSNYLGGTFVPKENKNMDPQFLISTLASVRTNPAGLPTRTFVDLSSNKVGHNNIKCLDVFFLF